MNRPSPSRAASMLGLVISLAISAPLFAEQGYTMDEKEAPCTVGDGYQTVNFPGGTSYSGNFLNCHPQSGNAEIIQNGQRISGYAQAVGNDQVTLKFDGGVVTIKVITRRVRH